MKALITGATGSFGTALIKRLLADNLAEKIVAYSRCEYRQAQLAETVAHDSRVRFFLGDVRDSGRLHEAMYRIDTIVHAAALKRIDAVAHDPHELFKTNIDGTINVVRAANERGIGKVIVLSSDKCCQPSTSYGVSKLAAEMYATQANAIGYPSTKIACVRYGNVLDSRGSVLQIWREQIAKGLPLTITDERCTRFWLPMKQAVDFVLHSLRKMRGGEIFIPRLPAMRVVDLAEAMAPGHPLKVIGMRAGGEKLHELLLSEDESPRAVFVASFGNLGFDGYVLDPMVKAWPYESWRGDRCGIGFHYSSLDAPQLSIEQMRTMLQEGP